MRTGFVALLWFISALFPFVYEDPEDLTTGQDTIVRSSTTVTENGGVLGTPGG